MTVLDHSLPSWSGYSGDFLVLLGLVLLIIGQEQLRFVLLNNAHDQHLKAAIVHLEHPCQVPLFL